MGATKKANARCRRPAILLVVCLFPDFTLPHGIKMWFSDAQPKIKIFFWISLSLSERLRTFF
jgi:hypothetical protein